MSMTLLPMAGTAPLAGQGWKGGLEAATLWQPQTEMNAADDSPQVEVTIEIPRGSCLKRGWIDRIDFVSPLPCPFNYGAVHRFVGGDGDFLDAVVLGPRVGRGRKVTLPARGAVGFTDRGIYDDKLICSRRPLSGHGRRWVLRFFHLYAFCKRQLNRLRRCSGLTRCEGWTTAQAAIARADRQAAGVAYRRNVPF